jgi:GxxExxY protein
MKTNLSLIVLYLCLSVSICGQIFSSQVMEATVNDEQLNALTERIIGCAFKVSNALGCGFLEKVYENALVHELRKQGLKAEAQRAINVYYDGILVGEFFADILVEETVLLELKATNDHAAVFTAQCLNYLKATGKPLCLLLNFGKPRLDIKRYRGRPERIATDKHG